MSTDGLMVELRDGILVLTLANPPLNDLSPVLRARLVQAIADRGETCRGIVLAAQGPNFAGLLPTEADASQPSLAELCRIFAECPVPVVAVMQGLVTGPGAELVLAARARLGSSSLRLAFADATLGLCPRGGTTQRLPKLIGAKAALRLLLSGRAVPASDALALGLIDGITETAPIASAMRLAGALSVGDLLQRGEPDAVAWTSAVAEARTTQAARSTAGRRIIDCVEAALILPPENAQAFETVALNDLEQTETAIGLCAAARAEQRALAVPPVLSQLQGLSVDRIGLVGLAADLARIAVVALSRELLVTWSFPDAFARQAGLAAVEAGIEEGLRAGRLSADRAMAMSERFSAVEAPLDETSMPFIVTDQMPTEIKEATSPGAARLVLGGHEDEMGLALALAGRVCELTFPPGSMPLARVTALAGLRRMGLSPVMAGHRPVIGARMTDAGRTALAWMVAHGVPQRMIAAALEGFGVRLPDPVSIEAPKILRAMSATEILNRWLSALANEGARLLDEGVARRPSDIDHLMVAGYHFPRWRGGPMHQADRRGLMVLRHDLRSWGGEAALWSPAPLVDRLIREGQSLATLDG